MSIWTDFARWHHLHRQKTWRIFLAKLQYFTNLDFPEVRGPTSLLIRSLLGAKKVGSWGHPPPGPRPVSDPTSFHSWRRKCGSTWGMAPQRISGSCNDVECLGCKTGCMVYWLIECLIHWFIDCLFDLLIHWLVHWFDCLIGWLVWLFDLLIDYLFVWLIDSLIHWLFDWLIDWLIWLIGSLFWFLHRIRCLRCEWLDDQAVEVPISEVANISATLIVT